MSSTRPWRVVGLLGSAQTLAWASSFYLPAMLATPMSADLGVGAPTVFAAFSVALVVSAMVGPWAGRSIDRWGGRPVLLATNLVFATGLVSLGLAQDVVGLFAAWVVLGVAMGTGLYDAAFATLVRLYGRDSRSAITGITLVAGFASTVGWPLTTLFEAQFGWRGACLAWAALHLVLGVPLNALLPRARLAPPDGDQATLDAAAEPAAESEGRVAAVVSPKPPVPQAARVAVLLAVVFAVTGFISTAMAAHLPRLLDASGVGLAAAVAIAALVGPAQVGGRLLEFGLLRHLHPLLSARLAAALHPLGAVALLVLATPAAALFALLHGAGNGILTITKGTLPLALFGPEDYGQRQGVLMIPARAAQALAPWVFGVMLDRMGVASLWVTAALGGLAVAALLMLPKPRRDP